MKQKIRIKRKKDLESSIRDAIDSKPTKTANKLEILNNITSKYTKKYEDRNIEKLSLEIRTIIRKNNKFIKTRRENPLDLFQWKIKPRKIFEDDASEEQNDLQIRNRLINLPLIRSEVISGDTVVVYNSLYHCKTKNGIEPIYRHYKPENIYDVKRNMGDFLRRYFSLHKTYLEVKKKTLEGNVGKMDFMALLDQADIKADFISEECDYLYINNIITGICNDYKNTENKGDKSPLRIAKDKIENNVLYLSEVDNAYTYERN